MVYEVDCEPCGGAGFSYETGGRCRICRGSGRRVVHGPAEPTKSGLPKVPSWMPQLGCGTRIVLAAVLLVVVFPVVTVILIAAGAYDSGSDRRESPGQAGDDPARWTEPVEMELFATHACGGDLTTYAMELRAVPSAEGDAALVSANLIENRDGERLSWTMNGSIADGMLELRAEDAAAPIPAVRGPIHGPDVQEVRGPSKVEGCTQVILERVR